MPLGFTVGAWQTAHGENQADYRYEYYSEEGGRMTIETHSAYFEQQIIDSIIAQGEFTYDSISGATPTGLYDTGGKVAMTELKDTRFAGNLDLNIAVGRQTLSPGFAYSSESDYLSKGLSLNDAIQFNDKNTTLQLGFSHNFDRVRHADRRTWSPKDSTEALVGVSQLISPVTIFNAAFTYGYDSGYLTDPYRFITFSLSGLGYPEVRPTSRTKETLYLDLTHYFNPINASLEGSYRFYHDSYDIFSHTVMLTWHQKIGRLFIVEPFGRFYQQSAASFYTMSVNGFFPTDPLPRPPFYSADYRLSEFYSVDFGLQATVIINDHLRVIAGYHRYEMHGLDNTPAGAYPRANVFTAGLSILW